MAKRQSVTRSSQRRKPVKKQRSSVWLWLIGLVLIGLVIWVLLQTPLNFFLLCIVLLLLFLMGWLAFRRFRRLSKEYLDDQQKQAERSAPPTEMGQIQVGHLHQLRSDEFEHFVGALLAATGTYAEMQHVGGSGDRGVDLLASRGGLRVAIQCKRYRPDRAVLPKEIRELSHLFSFRGQRADEVLLATTGRITQQGRSEAATQSRDIGFLDGTALLELTRQFYTALPIEWQRRFWAMGVRMEDDAE